MQIVHVQTQITTVLGTLDDDGNVTQTFTLQAQPTSLSDEAWIDQARLLRAKRDELAAELAEQHARALEDGVDAERPTPATGA